MLRFDTRQPATTRVGLAVGGLLVASALAGCGAGQVSQVATQEPAVNGTTGNVGPIALRNVHIQAVESGDALEPGSDVELIFAAANSSPDVNDRLVGITSDVGTVTVTGNTALPASGLLTVGSPDGVTELSADRSRRRRRRGRCADQADPQWPDLRLHLHLREGR